MPHPVHPPALRGAQEERELASDPRFTQHMLGKTVDRVMDEQEKAIHGDTTLLDRFVTEHKTATAHAALAHAQRALEAGAASATARALDAAWAGLEELTEFKRKTLLSNGWWLFPRYLEQREQRRQQQTEEWRQRAWRHGDDAEQAVEQADAAEKARRAGLEATRLAVERGALFVPAAKFFGAIEGLVFGTGERGLGYYQDAAADTAARQAQAAAQVREMVAAVLRALRDQLKHLGAAVSRETAALASQGVPLAAVEAALGALRQQAALTRALKVQHRAERTAVFKEALRDEVDADLALAESEPPVPTVTGE